MMDELNFYKKGKNISDYNAPKSIAYSCDQRQAITTKEALIIFNVKNWDLHNDYDNTTGIYKAPISAQYYINFQIIIEPTNLREGQTLKAALYPYSTDYSYNNVVAISPVSTISKQAMRLAGTFILPYKDIDVSQEIYLFFSSNVEGVALNGNKKDNFLEIIALEGK